MIKERQGEVKVGLRNAVGADLSSGRKKGVEKATLEGQEIDGIRRGDSVLESWLTALED